MRNQSASVLLPPAQDQKVMIMGGGPAGKPNKTDAIDNVDIVDLKQPNPAFAPASPLNFPRRRGLESVVASRAIVPGRSRAKTFSAPQPIRNDIRSVGRGHDNDARLGPVVLTGPSLGARPGCHRVTLSGMDCAEP